MKRSKFSSGQIVMILKEFEEENPHHEICWEHGISQATLNKWHLFLCFRR